MPRNQPQADRLLTVSQVAELIALDESTIYQGECGTDELLRVPAGTRVLFSYNDVQAWIATRVEAARKERQEQRRKEREKADRRAAVKPALRVVTEQAKRPRGGTV